MKTKPVLTLKVPVEWGSVSRWCRNRARGVTTVKQRWAVDGGNRAHGLITGPMEGADGRLLGRAKPRVNF